MGQCFGITFLTMNTCYCMSINTAAVNVQIVAHRFVNCILHNSFTFYVLAYKSIPNIPPPKKTNLMMMGTQKLLMLMMLTACQA